MARRPVKSKTYTLTMLGEDAEYTEDAVIEMGNGLFPELMLEFPRLFGYKNTAAVLAAWKKEEIDAIH